MENKNTHSKILSQNARTNTRYLCECAILLAMSIVLSFFSVTPGSFGGSITPASMLPILLVGLRHGPKWGFGTAFAYSVFQLITGIGYFSYVKGLGQYLICLLFDFVLAFTALGISSFARVKYENGEAKFSLVKIFSFMTLAMVTRFICHFISGVTIWRSYDVYNNPWLYSLVYNVLYMLPDMLIALATAALLLASKKGRDFILIR